MTSIAPITEPLFYCAALPASGDITLTDDEAHHVKVQRLRVGDRIAVFNGRGQAAIGSIQSLRRDEVGIVVERRITAAAPTPRIDLYCAVPKGDRASVLLDMATQLGMDRFIPLRTQRGVVDPSARAEERWRRICLEACKQSRRLYLPEISPPLDLVAAISAARTQSAVLLVAHPDPDAERINTVELRSASGGAVIGMFIGPEGGFATEEVVMLRDAGARVVHLGQAILRIETAAVGMVAAIRLLD